jgi:hypothetical protein
MTVTIIVGANPLMAHFHKQKTHFNAFSKVHRTAKRKTNHFLFSFLIIVQMLLFFFLVVLKGIQQHCVTTTPQNT